MTFQDYQLTRKAVLRNNMFKIAQYLVFLLIWINLQCLVHCTLKW